MIRKSVSPGSRLTSAWKALVPVAILSLIGSDLAHAQENIYFNENFHNYSTKAPLVVDVEGITLDNDPIWSQTAGLNASLNQDTLIFREYATVNPLDVCDVKFDFKLNGNNEAPGRVDMRLQLQSSGKTGDLGVVIHTDKLVLTSPSGSVISETKLPFTIALNIWHTAVVKVQKGNIAVYIDHQRAMQQVATAKLPGNFVVSGLNFFGHAKAPFSISYITLSDPAPLPDRSIANNLLPVSRKIDPSAFKKAASVTIPANSVFGATVLTGAGKEGVTATIHWNDGKTDAFNMKIADLDIGDEPDRLRQLGFENHARPDSIIRIINNNNNRMRLDYYIKPKLRRYRTSYSSTSQYADIVRDWNVLTNASEHPLKIEAQTTPTGVDLYLDGKLAFSLTGSGVKGMQITADPTAAVGPTFSYQTTHNSSKYLPLDITSQNLTRSFADAKASLKPGHSEVNGIPLIVAPAQASADIGLTREGQGSWALEVDEYLARSPFDGFLSEVHFTVPGGVPYTKAWVLAAVDPDTSKDPIFTTRLARYEENGVGGNHLVDTTITLPRSGETPGKGIQAVGNVTLKDKNGKQVEVPLYLVEVPLRTGEIIDLVMKYPTMNFEFFGKPWEHLQQIDNSIKPDPLSTSAVQIFGVTLEKASVGLEMVQSQPANVFHNNDVPETTAVLKAVAPGKGSISWEILDIDNNKISDGSANFSLNKGAEQKFPISLKTPDVGWFQLLVSVKDEAGNVQYTHPARFAQLGKDERKARFDSPYGVWWFDGAHNTPSEPAFGGPILFKAGLRKIGWTGKSTAEMDPWVITRGQLALSVNLHPLRDNPGPTLAAMEKSLNEQIQKWPHAKEVFIFHESGPGNALPSELFGQKPEQTEWQRNNEALYANALNLVGEMVRTKFPQLKTVVGNTSSSMSTIAAALRHGGKHEYIDYIGIETPSQVYIPEKLQEWGFQGMVMTKDLAKILSGREIPLTGCYEFTYRTVRDMGLQQQAQWYSRDVLISLANSFTNIAPGILFDVSNSYANGLWGGSGLMERGPSGYPRPSYVAIATLTNVFDQVSNPRQISTGSTTVYAFEFDRSDKKKVSALWASRGDAEFHIQFAGDTDVKIVDMYGRSKQEKTSGGKLTVTAGASPAYLIANQTIRSISLGKRSFPQDDARAQQAKVVAPLSLGSIEIVADNSLDTPPFKNQVQLPVRKAGQFELRATTDADKGDSLELELKTVGELNQYITEYATLRLKEPVEVPGQPDALGIWVKGNSNWGRVMYEIEDADGEIWRSIGTDGWGCDILDWAGHASVNFDGWNFISLPLAKTSLFRDYSPGPVLEQWVSSGGDKKITYPIKLRGLIVEMNRKAIDLLDLKATTPVIRLKDISGVYAKENQ